MTYKAPFGYGQPYIEKNSRFFGVFVKVQNVAEFKNLLEEIKAEHKKAKHFCYAYIIDEKTAGNQISFFNETIHREKYFNDGEPSGCSNALLGILKQNKACNCALIVVRYFGGVLLGSGNLIRAYTTAGRSAFLKNI
jgi:putative IMPACT (imprinted ancient) family translation regulator